MQLRVMHGKLPLERVARPQLKPWSACCRAAEAVASERAAKDAPALRSTFAHFAPWVATGVCCLRLCLCLWYWSLKLECAERGRGSV